VPPSNRHRQVSVRTARVHYARWGSTGPRVLLLHPIGFDHHTWSGVVPYLENACQLVAPDLPGHGQSDKPAATDYGIASLAGRMLALLDELEWPDALFIGNSLGGGVSLASALQAPERVRGLALCNSVGFRNGLPPVGRLSFLPLVSTVAGYTPGLAMRLGLEFARSGWGTCSPERHQLAGAYMRNREGRAAFFRILRQLYGPDLDRMAARYGEIRCPTVVIHGVHDPLIRLAHAERLAAAIPRAELLPIPRCGHFPQEEAPMVLGPALRSFVDRAADP